MHGSDRVQLPVAQERFNASHDAPPHPSAIRVRLNFCSQVLVPCTGAQRPSSIQAVGVQLTFNSVSVAGKHKEGHSLSGRFAPATSSIVVRLCARVAAFGVRVVASETLREGHEQGNACLLSTDRLLAADAAHRRAASRPLAPGRVALR